MRNVGSVPYKLHANLLYQVFRCLRSAQCIFCIYDEQCWVTDVVAEVALRVRTYLV